MVASGPLHPLECLDRLPDRDRLVAFWFSWLGAFESVWLVASLCCLAVEGFQAPPASFNFGFPQQLESVGCNSLQAPDGPSEQWNLGSHDDATMVVRR